MRFIVDADLPRQSVALLEKYGHTGEDVRDIGMGRADDSAIGEYARRYSACILTGDFGFADIRAYPPQEYSGIVVLEFPNTSTAQFILGLLESFLHDRQAIAQLPGRLAIVRHGRVRLRRA